MNLEKELQKVPVGQTLRFEDDLDPLGMGAMVAIGRVGDITAGVPDTRGNDAGHFSDQILHTPETAAGKNRPFRFCRSYRYSQCVPWMMLTKS